MQATAAAMPEVYYAARTPLRRTLRRYLEKHWFVKEVTVSEMVKSEDLPEFLWLNLGRVSKAAEPIALIRKMADKQADAKTRPFIFISGSVSKSTHLQLAEAIYENFPDPLFVQVDLAGEPDVLSALEKFRIIRSRKTAAVTPSRSGSALEVPNADLRSESGRLSARLVSEVFGVTMVELGQWIGSKKAALSKTPDADSIQDALKDFARVALFRKALGGEVPFRQWLRTENQLLEGKSPLDWIKLGRVREVGDFVEDALAGQPT